ncbi:double-stranded RNA-binding protein 4-like [Corylus avellana]|uniref:double-stranded RNA-binding protein 4-like n=1 Tax=Corylus avellana TaxID=13451 RepID=UPI00286B8F94|nr:double-stranded RNA-binding protein 4-like [Corylus avellana]
MYKSRLQELCHQRSWTLPEYSSIRDGPDHNPRFTATVTVNGERFQTRNACKSSKEAQNDAARDAFYRFTNPKPPPPLPSILSSFGHFPQPSLPSSSGASSGSTDLDTVLPVSNALQPKVQEIYQTPQVNGTALHVNNDDRSRDMQHLYKNHLQNYAQKRNLSLPVYSCEREGPPHASRFKCKVTIDGQTYESPEFFATLKDAEHAAAKVALSSLSPDGVKEDDLGLYKNLLQELVQKEGFRLPVYDTNRSGESHVPIFVSTVEIDGEIFKGHEAGTKKQAEMSAAKVAYTTLKERKSGQSPLILRPPHQEDAPEFSSSSLRPNFTSDLQQHVGAKDPAMSMNPCTITEGQAEDRVSAEDSRYHPSSLSSGLDSMTSSRGSSSSNSLNACAPDTVFSDIPHMSENGLSQPSSPSDCSTELAVDSSLLLAAGMSSSSRKRVFVYSRTPNMTNPKGFTILPRSDDKWVAYSPN